MIELRPLEETDREQFILDNQEAVNYELLNKQGIHTALEWNEGNHFKDADIRTAKAFAWAMKNRME